MKSLEELDLSKKKYIIFDLDGTLIDSIGMWNLTDYYLIKKYSGKEIDEETIQNDRDYYLHNNTTGDIYAGYCKFLINKYNFDFKEYRQLSTIRRKLYEEIYDNEVTFKPNVVRLLQLLHEKGYTLVLATMSTNAQIKTYSNNKHLSEKVDIKEIFDLITTKESVKNKKPDPEIYNNIIKYFNATPEECLVFEDSFSGVTASKRAGIDTVNIYDKYSDKDREKINEIADYSIQNYEEFITKTLLKIKELLLVKNNLP